MKLHAIVSLLSLSLLHASAAPKDRRDVDTTRKVFYTNLCRLTLGLAKFVQSNIQYMEKRMPLGGSRINVPKLPFTHQLNLNETQKLDSYVTQLQYFMPRIKTAISVERSLKGQQFLYNLTMVQYQVMNAKATFRHFMKLLSLPVVKKSRGKITSNKSTRRESLGMLKNLKVTLVLMNYELNESRSNFTN